MDKMQFENGTLVSPAKVVIDGVEYEVIPAVYEGNTPFSAENINKMQDNMEEAIDEISVAIYGTGDEKGLIDPNTTLENLILTQNANGPDGGTSFYYIRTTFYEGKTVESNRCQMAYGYSTNKVWFRYFYNGIWSTWERVDREVERTITSSGDVASITTGSWQDMLTTPININVEAGKYLCVISFTVSGLTGNGMATIRPRIDDSESSAAHRCSLPIGSGLLSSGQISFYTAVTAGTHTINAQIFSNVEVKPGIIYAELYKIGEV